MLYSIFLYFTKKGGRKNSIPPSASNLTLSTFNNHPKSNIIFFCRKQCTFPHFIRACIEKSNQHTMYNPVFMIPESGVIAYRLFYPVSFIRAISAASGLSAGLHKAKQAEVQDGSNLRYTLPDA